MEVFMAKFFLFSLGFAMFFFGAFIITMCIVTGETALEAWIGGIFATFGGCLGVGKFLDCNV
jgi:hypothetical protein